MTDRILYGGLAALLLIVLVTMCALPARAHGEDGWMAKYANAMGQSCCHEADTVAIPNEVAAVAVIGSVILALFPSGPMLVTVNAIHATEDREGRAMISRYGCLFKSFAG